MKNHSGEYVQNLFGHFPHFLIFHSQQRVEVKHLPFFLSCNLLCVPIMSLYKTRISVYSVYIFSL